MADVEARPVYRHLVVARKGYANLTTDRAQLHEARRQLREVEEGVRAQVDQHLQHLVKRERFRETLAKTYGNTYTDAQLDEMARDMDRSQGGAIVVATLNKQMIPGGNEPLPQTATFLTRPALYDEMPPQQAFLKAAEELQQVFEARSDALIKLLPDDVRQGVTLVTVVYAPIAAYPHPRRDRGFEVACEFIQKTRFSQVDAEGFAVYSDTGTYPIQAPSEQTLLYLMNPPEVFNRLDRGVERRTIDDQRRLRPDEREALDVLASMDDPGATTPPPKTLLPKPEPAKEPPPLKRFAKLEFD